jgi:hypothetical protein
MPRFRRSDGRYRVSIITGPQSALLELELFAERIEAFAVEDLPSGRLDRDLSPEVVRARVLEGTDAANREFGTTFHPWLARYVVESYSEECSILRRAAHAIVERLARHGDDGYDGMS